MGTDAEPINYQIFETPLITDIAQTSMQLSGLTQGTKYYVAVRAFYRSGSGDYRWDLNTKRFEVSTLSMTPPTFAGISRARQHATSDGKGIVKVDWQTPSNDGIWNNFEVWYETGSCSADPTRNSFQNPTKQIVSNMQDRSLLISDLTLNTKYRFAVKAVFNGSPPLVDSNTACIEVTPGASAPSFAGIAAISQQGNANDFNRFVASWTLPSGDCDAIDVAIATSPFGADFSSPAATVPCTASSAAVTGLSANTTYYVQARAKLAVGEGFLYSGANVELSVTTSIEKPNGDGVEALSLIDNSAAVDQIQVTYSLPSTNKGWNRIYIWQATGATESDAQAAVMSQVMAADSSSNPSSAVHQVPKASTWTATPSTYLHEAELGVWNCFMMRAAFFDDPYYSASLNDKVECIEPPYSPPSTGGGLLSATYDSSRYDAQNPDYGWIEFALKDFPTGSIDEYRIYYSEDASISSFDFFNPNYTVAYGDSQADANSVDKFINLRLPVSQLKDGYFVLRAFAYGGTTQDTNTSVVGFVSNSGAVLDHSIVASRSEGSYIQLSFKGDVIQNFQSSRLLLSESLDAAGNLEEPITTHVFGEYPIICENSLDDWCVLSLEDEPLWKPFYFQYFAIDNNGQFRKSKIMAHARVPNGMVYVDRKLWPKEGVHRYEDWETYSFAIDRYENTPWPGTGDVDNLGFILQSRYTGMPQTDITWNQASRGCFNRGTKYPASIDSSIGNSHPARQFRLPTSLEAVVAAYGTPTASCNQLSGSLADVDDSTYRSCRSFFGAQNLIGNAEDWIDLVYKGKNFLKHSYVNGGSKAQILPVGNGPSSSSTVTDFDIKTGTPILGTNTGPWTADPSRSVGFFYELEGRPEHLDGDGHTIGAHYGAGTNLGRFTTQSYGLDSSYQWRGARCALAAPTPGAIEFVNDSDGSTARFRWRMQGESAGYQIIIALAKEDAYLKAWNGQNIAGSNLGSDVATYSNFNQCDLSAYNSQNYETQGDGSTTSGQFQLQGRCGIDLSLINRWDKRYVQLAVSYGGEVIKSDRYIIARVPDGMVFVDADDWPHPDKHYLAAKYGEQYTAPYDFAIDKYIGRMTGSGNHQCSSSDAPCTSDPDLVLSSNGNEPTQYATWFGFRQGCEGRNKAELFDAAWQNTSGGEKFRLPTGTEFVVASFGTPDAEGPSFCHQSADFRPIAYENSVQKREVVQNCISRYGAMNMIGFFREYTNEVFFEGTMRRHYRTDTSGIDLGLSSSYSVPTGAITSWDYGYALPTNTDSSAVVSFHQADRFGSSGFPLSAIGSSGRTITRGGSYHDGEKAGRFRINTTKKISEPTGYHGARCAIKAP